MVDREIWDILCDRYGGRCIRRYSVAVPTDDPTRPDYIVEVQMRKFKIISWPKVRYFTKNVIKEVYVSRADSVKELISRICNSTLYDELCDKVGLGLAVSCRLWVMEGDTEF